MSNHCNVDDNESSRTYCNSMDELYGGESNKLDNDNMVDFDNNAICDAGGLPHEQDQEDECGV